MALLGIFAAVGVALAGPSLTYPMVFDDLVLLRRFGWTDIRGSFVGQWDPEALMTQGLRPGSILFNHFRYVVFGEHVVAQRLFLLALYAAYSTLMVRLVVCLGVPFGAAVWSQVLAMSSVYSVFHYVWLTDGNHLVQGLAFVSSALLLLAGLARRSRVTLVLSLCLFMVGVGTREDTVAAAPALLLLGFVYGRRRAAPRPWLAAYALALAFAIVAFFAYRRQVLQAWAPQPGFDLVGLMRLAAKASNPAGLATFGPASTALSVGWWAILAAVAVALLRHRRTVDWRTPALWLGCGLLACSPGLVLQRDDLLFFSVSFVGVACASAIWPLLRQGPISMVLGLTALLVGPLSGAFMSRVFAENFHPRSLRALWWNGRYVYGAYAFNAGGHGGEAWKEVIPHERRQRVVDQLSTVGIGNRWQSEHKIANKLLPEALSNGWRRPAEDRPFFQPLLPWDED